ncbi:hypothetical protein [Xanthomonas translucens]|uniref:Uncharacterized protein n=1 Tax=Xanthomonas translucens pv. translucens TaxID=134875 RepID=A0ABW9KR88_XANCT|nr:hypothetical protein [Xanthomonas translucens]QSQ28874.1 hypothetical protein ISN30_10825 [Xanthomonas translucens pv. translucens]QSQ34900.1 hypothetical protein ISN31_04660 [Xanthomonas translucens pv. translucens]QSQ43706.1 hypothetical protein ISN34_10100 [Xanthomonas translucens pv. translucens]UNU00349.1 hypothetical protein KBQ49_06990 [Xanthomonas translucens pv. translucens]
MAHAELSNVVLWFSDQARSRGSVSFKCTEAYSRSRTAGVIADLSPGHARLVRDSHVHSVFFPVFIKMHLFSKATLAESRLYPSGLTPLSGSVMTLSIGLLLAAPVHAQQAPSSQTAPSSNASIPVDLDT